MTIGGRDGMEHMLIDVGDESGEAVLRTCMMDDML